jgi:hypothetical protein
MFYHPFRHLGLKLLSIGIAVLLWLTVAGEPIVERSLRVPLELQNIPADLVVVESPPGQVDVRVRGASSALTHLANGDVVAVLELERVRAGRRLFSLTPAHVRAPFGIAVEQVTPGTVAVRFEASGTKTVPVEPAIDGKPAEGYVVQNVVSDPGSVDVVGPESSLRLLTNAVTEGVSVEGAAGTVRATVTIGVGDPRLRLVTPQTARVTVAIVPALSERTIVSVPIRLRNVTPTLRARVTPSVATVFVRGPGNVLSALAVDTIAAHVDLAGLGPGRYNLPIRIVPPENVEIVRTQPATVSVTVQ